MRKFYRNKLLSGKSVFRHKSGALLNRFLVFFLSLIIISSSIISAPANVNAENITAYPIMKLTAEERALQNEMLVNAPAATIDKQIQQQLQSSQEGNSFSLLSRIYYVPSERNQANCGNCWVWAGTGIMEIALNVQLGITDRLSIQYLNSNYNGGTGDDWACNGGNAIKFANFYNSQKIIIPWSNINADFQDQYSTTGTAVSASSICNAPSYLLASVTYGLITTHDVGAETAIANIKNILNQNKGIYFSFAFANEDDWIQFFNFWGTQPESSIWNYGFSDGEVWDYETGGGHAVLCVGYDDSDLNPVNHYWIMLNSWGTANGRPNGLFRIPMYYDYDDADSDGYYNTSWWTISPNYLAYVPKEISIPSTPSINTNPKYVVPAVW